MRCLHAFQICLLLSVSLTLVTCDFWDDLVDAAEDIVDDIIDDENSFDLDDIVDGVGDILGGSDGIRPGGNIGGDENSIFDGRFTPVNVGTETDDADGDGESDVEAFLNQLQVFAEQLGQLVFSDGALSRDEIYEVLDTFLNSDTSEEDLLVDQDEIFELLLSAMLEYIFDDLGIDVSDKVVDEKLVPLVMDVYNVVKEYTTNVTRLRNNSTEGNGGDSDGLDNLDQMDFVEDILEVVLENFFPNLTRKDIFCRAASNGVERFINQVSNLEKDAQKRMVKSLSLLVLGCQEGEIKEMILDQTGRLKDMLMSSLNGSLIQDILRNVKIGLSNFAINGTSSSGLEDQRLNMTELDDRLLTSWLQNIGSLRPSSNVSRRNRTGAIRDLNQLSNFWQPGFQGLSRVRNLFDFLAGDDNTNNQTQTTRYPRTLETETTEDENTRTMSTTKPTGTTITETSTTATTTRPTVTTTPTTATQSTTAAATTTTTQIPTITTKPISTTTVSGRTNATTALPVSTSTATPTFNSTPSSPFFLRRQRIREFRNDLRETVTNATERLAQLVREEIRSSELAQLIYTLLNSDLVMAILQAFDITDIPVQTTVMTTPDITFSTSESVPFSERDVRIERISPEDSDPVASAMVQTTIQVIQRANLSDPASIVSTASQILLDNARQTIQDEVLSDPLDFLTSVVDFLTRNNSLLSRFVPEETMTSISGGFESAVQATQVATSLAGIYSTSASYGTSQRCTAERGAVGVGITQFEVWALTFLDSIGKLGTGFLQGNTWLEGNYDQCKAIYGTTENGDVIEGHFVKFRFKLKASGLSTSPSILSSADTGFPNIIWFVCMPMGCNSDDVTKIGETIANSVGSSIETVEATIIEKRDPKSEAAFIVAIAVLSALCLLCLAGTAVDIAMREPRPDTSDKPEVVSGQTKAKQKKSKRKEVSSTLPDEEIRTPTGEKIMGQANFRNLRADLHNMSKAEDQSNATPVSPSVSATPQEKSTIAKYLIAFSVYTNTSDVMKAAHASGDLTCLHGIRVISILWVILGHVYYFLPEIGNIASLAEMTKWWTLHAILNAPYAVDTFFTISGCLVSYLFLRMAKKAGGVKVPHLVMYYVHRYLRLTPLYALAILVYHGITPYLEEGPFQQELDDRGKNCEDLWWTNLLYFSNLRRDFRQCMGWSWYLPNDMQFYAVAPLVLVPLALGYKYLGLLVAFLQVALHLILYAVLVEKYDASLIRNSLEFFIHIYIKPYARCGPYAIGLALGYLLFKTKGTFKIPRVLVGLGWLLALGGGLTLVYVTHDNLRDFGVVKPTWSDNQMNALDIVGKPLWALCVAWVILACVNGYGGVINSILSWTAWVPLSRLTFGTYLIHPMILMYFNNNQRTLVYFTYQFVIERFLATVLLSFALSYLLSLLIETPVRNIIKPSRKAKHTQPASKPRQDQDKKLKALSISSLGKSRAEGSRIRNVYLPDDVESRIPSLEPTVVSSPEPDIRSHPVSAGRGLYPILHSSEGTQHVRGSAYPNVAFETLTKTVSFDDEDTTIINPVYTSLLDQPNSPTVAQQQRPFLHHRQPLTHKPQPQRTELENLENNQSSQTPMRTGNSQQQTFEKEATTFPPFTLGNVYADDNNQRGAENKKDHAAKEAESIPLQPIKQNTTAKVPPASETGETTAHAPLRYPDGGPFLTMIPTLEDPPSSVLTGPETGGVVNEAFADDVPVLPSAPPQTPSSGRSEKSSTADEAVLA